MGFGATTVLLNLHNAGIIAATSLGMIFAMGIFYGGLAQIIAGVLEFRKGNTFGTLAFTSYGLFWISLVALLLFPKMGLALRSTTCPWPSTWACGDCSRVHVRRHAE